MPAASAVPVLVLGGGLTALGVIRTLGRARIPSYVVTDHSDFVRHSRWFRGAPPSSVGAPAEGGLEGYLKGLPVERAVLMPCSDIWTAEAARLEPPLALRFPSSLAAPCALQAFLDKACLTRALVAAGIPHPCTMEVSRPADLDMIPDEAFTCCFLKPRDSQRFFRRFGVKAFRVGGRDEAAEKLRTIAASGLAAIFQEYIPGPASNHFFVDGFVSRQGRLVAAFARQRLRMYPLDFGNSTYMVSVPQEQVAGAITAVGQLMEHVRYRGIFNAEFKHDERDGLYKMLEVNARPWWYVEFAARCGVDVCYMAYRDALGLPVEPATAYRVGRTLVYPHYDYGACREQLRKGQLSFWTWARSWLTAEQPVFRWSDPLPALIETSEGLGRRLRHMMSTSS